MAPAEPGRVAVVTGAASGIGATVAAELRDRGWGVAGLDMRPSSWDAEFIVDVSDEQEVAQAVTAAGAALGPVGAVVSAAGHYTMSEVTDVTPEQWHRMLRVHLGGFRNLARAVLPGMLARGAGRLVAVTSELALGGGDRDSHYASAKGALIGLVRSLALEVADRGVTVNAVAPGPTDTPLIGPDSPWRAPAYLATLPLQRLVLPEEVALTVAFLLEEGTFVTGEVLSPNAGAVI